MTGQGCIGIFFWWVKRFLTPGSKKRIGRCAPKDFAAMGHARDDLRRAIVDAGGYSKVGRQLGVTKQRIWSWANTLGRVPAEKVMDLEAAIGVPRSLIRPDLYPPERETSCS